MAGPNDVPPDVLVSLGIRINDILAGLAGGVVNALVFKRSNPLAIISSIVVGALTANYLGESAARYLSLWVNPGACSFVVGLTGMTVCQAIMGAVSKWKPKIGGSAP